MLVNAFDEHARELGEIEELIPDTVRLAVATGERDIARTIAARTAAYTAGSVIPHWQGHRLYCQGLLECDPGQLLRAADRYHEAGRPLLRAQALEAAADALARAANPDRDRARHIASEAMAIYAKLGANIDVRRLAAKLPSAVQFRIAPASRPPEK